MNRPFKAIAAMSLNRVIGDRNSIPWHLPEDFRWFKQTTTGQVIVMGRRTFESIGRPLPNRLTIVLSRSLGSIPGVLVLPGLEAIDLTAPAVAGRQVFICGGGEIYRQALPLCSDLFLTLVRRNVAGDTLFPPFEDQFELKEKIRDCPEFAILHYQSRE